MRSGFQPDEHAWLRRLHEVAEFVAAQRRWPRQHDGAAEERVMATWLSNQRRELRSRALSTEREQLMDAMLPGWRGHSS